MSIGTARGPRYVGEYTDAETGFQYLRARYYDPATGQFLTQDPIEAATREPYGYVGGNPLNATDPSGLCWGPTCIVEDVVGAGGAALGAGARAVGSGASWVVQNPTTTLKVGALALGGAALVVGTGGLAVPGLTVFGVSAATASTALGAASTFASFGVATLDCTKRRDLNCAASIAEFAGGAASTVFGGVAITASRPALRYLSNQLGFFFDAAAFADPCADW